MKVSLLCWILASSILCSSAFAGKKSSTSSALLKAAPLNPGASLPLSPPPLTSSDTTPQLLSPSSNEPAVPQSAPAEEEELVQAPAPVQNPPDAPQRGQKISRWFRKLFKVPSSPSASEAAASDAMPSAQTAHSHPLGELQAVEPSATSAELVTQDPDHSEDASHSRRLSLAQSSPESSENEELLTPVDDASHSLPRGMATPRRMKSKDRGQRTSRQPFLPQVPAGVLLDQDTSELEKQMMQREFQSLTKQKNRINKTIQLLQSELASIDEAYSRIKVKRSITEPDADEFRLILQDKLVHDFLTTQFLPQNHRSVFLALGNYQTVPSKKLAEAIHIIISGLIENDFFIAYDADARSSDIIRTELVALGGAHASLGITSKVRPENIDLDISSPPVATIFNPYLKLEALLSFSSIVITPDSLLGIGLLLDGFDQPGKFSVLDLYNQWTKGLSSWEHSLKEVQEEREPLAYDSLAFSWVRHQQHTVTRPRANLGISYPSLHEPNRSKKPEKLVTSIVSSLSQQARLAAIRKVGIDHEVRLPRCDLFTLVETLPLDHLMDNFRWAKSLYSKIDDLRSSQNAFLKNHYLPKKSFPRSLAFFGSAKGGVRYEKAITSVIDQLYQVDTRVLATGGAGGFMELANRRAIALKALSIGVPHSRGESFRETASSRNHDITVFAEDYSQRIPLILLDKDYVLVAPGGMGTMKEVATTFVQLAGNHEEKLQNVVFISPYYQPLVTWLNTLGLPSSFTQRIIEAD